MMAAVEGLRVGAIVRATDLELWGKILEIDWTLYAALVDFGNHERWHALGALEPRAWKQNQKRRTA